MPLMAGLLVTLFQAVTTFLAIRMATRTAFLLAAVGILWGLYGTMVTTMNTLVAPLATAIFSTSYGQFVGLLFPPIAGTCVAAITAAWAACTMYAYQKKALDMFVKQ